MVISVSRPGGVGTCNVGFRRVRKVKGTLSLHVDNLVNPLHLAFVHLTVGLNMIYK